MPDLNDLLVVAGASCSTYEIRLRLPKGAGRDALVAVVIRADLLQQAS